LPPTNRLRTWHSATNQTACQQSGPGTGRARSRCEPGLLTFVKGPEQHKT
jgi:hypothetical protein